MTTHLTLSEFLQQTAAQPRFFDLGRRITEMPSERFLAFENAAEPYPYPFLHAAWLGIVFRDPKADEHHIWFLRFSLDEQGRLIQAARDDFLSRIIDTAGNPQALEALGDNPHGFKPSAERMASFHAKIAQLLGQTPSQYYPHALDYFSGTPGFEQWKFVALQGIADVAARQAEHANMLASAIPELPTEPFMALCNGLENEPVGEALSRALSKRLDGELAQPEPDHALLAAGIRGLSLAENRERVIATLNKIVSRDAGRDTEILAAIAARAWEALFDTELRQGFLEQLAQCDGGQRAFGSIMADLLFLPTLRLLLLQDLRQPEPSASLAQAFNAMLSRYHTTSNKEI